MSARRVLDALCGRRVPGAGPDRPASAFSVVERCALVYLALPSLLFAGGWFRPWAAALLLAALLVGLAPLVCAPRAHEAAVGASRTGIVVALVIGLAWAALGGAGHFVYANATDWVVRDAVLRDLVVADWPPSYGRNAAGEAIVLRAPVGYFLPAAAIGKLAGLRYADAALYAWTAAGVVLVLAAMLEQVRGAGRMVVALAVIVLFSGMDIVGLWLQSFRWTGPAMHLEWWAQIFQYSSHSTQLFWVPNHALGAWIATVILWRHWRRPEIVPALPMLFALLPLWSPLSALGVGALMAFVFVHHAWRARGWPGPGGRELAAAAVLLAATLLYLTLDTAAARADAGAVLSEDIGPATFLRAYAVFALLEFGLVAALVLRLRPDPMLWTAVAVLAVLPFFRLGPGNDLVMRGGIASLMVLALACADALGDTARWRARTIACGALAAALLVGAATPLHEFWRALAEPRWAPHLRYSLLDVTRELPPHYAARLVHPVLSRLLRAPGTVPSRRLGDTTTGRR